MGVGVGVGVGLGVGVGVGVGVHAHEHVCERALNRAQVDARTNAAHYKRTHTHGQHKQPVGTMSPHGHVVWCHDCMLPSQHG